MRVILSDMSDRAKAKNILKRWNDTMLPITLDMPIPGKKQKKKPARGGGRP